MPATISGSPVVSAYVDDSTTQITAGITLTVNFDGVTGLHNARIVASSGNGFAAGTDIYLVITTGIVDGVNVAGYVVGSFSIQNRYAASNAQQTTLLAVKANTDNLPSDPSDASDITAQFAAVTSALATLSAYVDTEVAAILAKVNPLPSDPADASDIAASFAAVNTKLDAIDGGLETDWSEVEREQIRYRLGIDGSLAAPIAAAPSLATQSSVDALKATSDRLETTWQLDGSVYQFTANALELAPVGAGGNGGGPPVSQDNPCAQNPAQTRGPTTEPYPGALRARRKVLAP